MQVTPAEKNLQDAVLILSKFLLEKPEPTTENKAQFSVILNDYWDKMQVFEDEHGDPIRFMAAFQNEKFSSEERAEIYQTMLRYWNLSGNQITSSN